MLAQQVAEEADGARILLSLEGKDCGQLTAVASALQEALPAGSVVAEEHDALQLNHRRKASLEVVRRSPNAKTGQ